MDTLTPLDFRNFDKNINKVYYHTMQDKNYFKTITIRRNYFTGELQGFISNEINGFPPDGMEPISPLLLSRIMRMPNLSNSPF
jgi:hypothetical protein